MLCRGVRIRSGQDREGKVGGILDVKMMRQDEGKAGGRAEERGLEEAIEGVGNGEGHKAADGLGNTRRICGRELKWQRSSGRCARRHGS